MELKAKILHKSKQPERVTPNNNNFLVSPLHRGGCRLFKKVDGWPALNFLSLQEPRQKLKLYKL